MKNAVFWDVFRVVFVRTDVTEDCNASIIRLTRIGEVGTTLSVISNRNTLNPKSNQYNLIDIMPLAITENQFLSQNSPFYG
jgi:hypothetical protein